MYRLSSLVQHEFDCMIAWVTLVQPKRRLQRLIKRVEDSMRRRPLGESMFGFVLDEAWPQIATTGSGQALKIYNKVKANVQKTQKLVVQGKVGKVNILSGPRKYPAMAAGSLYGGLKPGSNFVIMANQRVGQPMTPSQRALASAQNTVRWSKVADQEDFNEATRELARHFPLEALSLIL